MKEVACSKKCLMNGMRMTAGHELATAEFILDQINPKMKKDEIIDHSKSAHKILKSVKWFMGSEDIGKGYVWRYFLATYFEVMYIIENLDGNVTAIKHYSEKRQYYHNQILAFNHAKRHDDFDEAFRNYIEENYKTWKDKSLPHFGSAYIVMVNRIKENYQ